MRFTLRQLDVFLETARYGTISRAANKLNISQSAASSALKELERQCDVQLFDRIGKRLVLNDLGRAIRARAESLVAQAKELEQDLMQKTDVGLLKIGATMTIGNYLAVPILTRYKDAHPNSEVTLEVANTHSIAEMVANFEIDVGMVEGSVNHPDLTFLPWIGDEIKIICAPSHPYANKCELTDTDLLGADWILRETGSATRQAFDIAMQDLIPYMNSPLELQHTEAIKRAVESGIGLGCLSSLALKEAFARGKLLDLKVGHRKMARQFYIVVHKDKFRTRAIERWIELC